MAPHKSRIIDPRTNEPVDYDQLQQRMAAPSLGSVRNETSLASSSNLTPRRLASILKAAENDNPEAYLSLAEEMEEKDLHYLSVLGTRKRQVAQLGITISAASKDADDEEIAKDVQENLLDNGVLDHAAFDMLDAVGKGFSLTELVWRMDGNRWLIDCLDWVNPRFVRHDRVTQRTPMLLDDNGTPQELPPFKFAYLEIKAKSGLPLRGGLARPVAWAWMFKNFGVKDWVQFCEVYGIPWRMGRYDGTASPDDRKALLQAVTALASDAAAIVPKNMDIQIVETSAKTASADLYSGLAKYFDDQVSKAVLGQTMTVDATPGKLGGGNEGSEVREDIERADAKALATCITQQIIRCFVDINHGPQQRYPAATIGRAETKDVANMLVAAEKLVPLGLKVRQSDIYEAVGFSQPQENDLLLTAPAPQPSPFALPPDPAGKDAAAIAARMVHFASQANSGGARQSDGIDVMVQHLLGDSEGMMSAPVAELRVAFAAATSFADLKRRIAALQIKGLDMDKLGDALTSASYQLLGGAILGDMIASQ